MRKRSPLFCMCIVLILYSMKRKSKRQTNDILTLQDRGIYELACLRIN